MNRGSHRTSARRTSGSAQCSSLSYSRSNWRWSNQCSCQVALASPSCWGDLRARPAALLRSVSLPRAVLSRCGPPSHFLPDNLLGSGSEQLVALIVGKAVVRPGLCLEERVLMLERFLSLGPQQGILRIFLKLFYPFQDHDKRAQNSDQVSRRGRAPAGRGQHRNRGRGRNLDSLNGRIPPPRLTLGKRVPLDRPVQSVQRCLLRRSQGNVTTACLGRLLLPWGHWRPLIEINELPSQQPLPPAAATG